MKQIIILCITLTLLHACEEVPTPINNTLSVIVDRTEETQEVTSSYLLKFLEPQNIYDGIEISLLNISDTKYNDRQSFEIGQGKTGMLSNEDQRRKRIRLLKKQFDKQLKASNQKTYDYQRSDIFRVFAKELNRLSKLDGNRSLVLISDLKEHSPVFSVYGKGKQQLFNHLDDVKKVFESSINIEDNLQGITIYIMYQPNVSDAELFSQLITLYKSIVESRGATVIVGYHYKTSI